MLRASLSTSPTGVGAGRMASGKSVSRPPPGFPKPLYCIDVASLTKPGYEFGPGEKEPLNLTDNWKRDQGFDYSIFLQPTIKIVF